MSIEKLHMAIFANDADQLARLLALSTDHVNEAFNGVCAPLFLAISLGNIKIARLLVDNGANIHIRNRLGGTPLLYAAERGRDSLVVDLIERGADPNCQNTVCLSTPLHYAVWQGHIPTIERLLERGAQILARDKYGDTPLRDALVRHDKPIIAVLKNSMMRQEEERLLNVAIVLRPLKLPVLVVYTVYCAHTLFAGICTVPRFDAWNLIVKINATE